MFQIFGNLDITKPIKNPTKLSSGVFRPSNARWPQELKTSRTDGEGERSKRKESSIFYFKFCGKIWELHWRLSYMDIYYSGRGQAARVNAERKRCWRSWENGLLKFWNILNFLYISWAPWTWNWVHFFCFKAVLTERNVHRLCDALLYNGRQRWFFFLVW